MTRKETRQISFCRLVGVKTYLAIGSLASERQSAHHEIFIPLLEPFPRKVSARFACELFPLGHKLIHRCGRVCSLVALIQHSPLLEPCARQMPQHIYPFLYFS